MGKKRRLKSEDSNPKTGLSFESDEESVHGESLSGSEEDTRDISSSEEDTYVPEKVKRRKVIRSKNDAEKDKNSKEETKSYSLDAKSDSENVDTRRNKCNTTMNRSSSATKDQVLDKNVHTANDQILETLEHINDMLESNDKSVNEKTKSFVDSSMSYIHMNVEETLRRRKPTQENMKQLWDCYFSITKKCKELSEDIKKYRHDFKEVKRDLRNIKNQSFELRKMYWSETRALRTRLQRSIRTDPHYKTNKTLLEDLGEYDPSSFVND